MTLLDLVLISFSTYFIFSVLAEYSIPNILKKSRLAICIISGINVILVSSFSILNPIYFSLAAAGIAYFFHVIKLGKRSPVNVKDDLLRQEKEFYEAEQKNQVLNNDNDSRQTQIIDEAKQKKPEFEPVNNAVNTGRTEQQPVKGIQQTINNQYPIVTKIITMQAPMTSNEFYKEATDSKMLLSDELIKKLTGETNSRLS